MDSRRANAHGITLGFRGSGICCSIKYVYRIVIRMSANPPPAPVLSAENLQQMEAARAGARKIRRAISVAKTDGWILMVFAFASLLVSGMSRSISGVGVSIILGVIAWVELKGAAQLRRLDGRWTKWLGFNQLILAAFIILCAWQFTQGLKGNDEEIVQIGNSFGLGVDADSAKAAADMVKQFIWLVFGAVVAASVLAQGSMALFYFSRRKHLDRYLQETPAWIIDLQRSGAIN